MLRRLPTAALLFALLGGVAPALAVEVETEQNVWPAWVARTNEAGQELGWQAVGPLFFKNPAPDGGTYRGFRPLYLRRDTAAGTFAESTVLYPLFIKRQSDAGNYRTWSVFNLINHSGATSAERDHIEPKTFDIFPFYFSRNTDSPESSYHALFPIAGSIQGRFGYDRLSWVVFPLYWKSEKAGVTTVSTPWPILKRSTGPGGHHGFNLWPLFGRTEKPGAYRQQFYLWPLIYKNESRLSEPQPKVQQGFLPFYTLDRSAESVSENYVWPFFGYTDRKAPQPYHETRYFWPLLVQGRGTDRYVNRWGPFYTHSIVKGVDKQWFVWPLIRQQTWDEDAVQRTRRQFLYFVIWSEEQSSLTNPNVPTAQKKHFWPLISVWDNGAGRRQMQFPSPLEVFFPSNDKVRQLYSPLFSLYRFDQRAPGDTRTALLWNAITWRRTPESREFHLGPLFSSQTHATGRRIAVGNGVIGFQRNGAEGAPWRMFLFDFSRKSAKSAASLSH